MKIYRKVVINIETGETIYEETYDYYGELALCGDGDNGGGSGGGSGGGFGESDVAGLSGAASAAGVGGTEGTSSNVGGYTGGSGGFTGSGGGGDGSSRGTTVGGSQTGNTISMSQGAHVGPDPGSSVAPSPAPGAIGGTGDSDYNSGGEDQITGGAVGSPPNVGNTAAIGVQSHVGPDPGSVDSDGNVIGFEGNIGAETLGPEGNVPGELGFSSKAAKAGFTAGNLLGGTTLGIGLGILSGLFGGSTVGSPGLEGSPDGSVGVGSGSTDTIDGTGTGASDYNSGRDGQDRAKAGAITIPTPTAPLAPVIPLATDDQNENRVITTPEDTIKTPAEVRLEARNRVRHVQRNQFGQMQTRLAKELGPLFVLTPRLF